MLTHLEQARSKGVVTSSSGNFAQGAAYAARRLGVDLQVVMMKSASGFKRQRTEELGATVVPCENTFKDRWDTTYRIAGESGRLLIHPYDSEETIAGDGTIGLELLEQVEGDFCVVVPISGGGVISGIATAIKEKRPGCRVVGAQPSANGSMARSLEAGKPVAVTPGPTLADALMIAQPGKRTFEIVRRLVDDVAAVDESEIRGAVKQLAEQQKLVVEGGGGGGRGGSAERKSEDRRTAGGCAYSAEGTFSRASWQRSWRHLSLHFSPHDGRSTRNKAVIPVS